MGLYKILKIVALILSLAGIVLWFMLVAKGDEAVKATGEGVSPMLVVAYITMAIVLLFVVVFVLKGIFAGNIKKTMITVGAFLAIVLVGYVLASGSTEGLPLVDNEPVTEGTSKMVGAGLNTFYILAVLAIGSMVLSGIKRITSR